MKTQSTWTKYEHIQLYQALSLSNYKLFFSMASTSEISCAVSITVISNTTTTMINVHMCSMPFAQIYNQDVGNGYAEIWTHLQHAFAYHIWLPNNCMQTFLICYCAYICCNYKYFYNWNRKVVPVNKSFKMATHRSRKIFCFSDSIISLKAYFTCSNSLLQLNKVKNSLLELT